MRRRRAPGACACGVALKPPAVPGYPAGLTGPWQQEAKSLAFPDRGGVVHRSIYC